MQKCAVRSIFLLILFCGIMLYRVIPAKAEQYSGKCGENVHWEYDKTTFTLTISGNGKITSSPWLDEFDEKQWGVDVVITDGVTSIPEGAFRFMWMDNVTIGADVIEIGNAAFSDCYIKKLQLPESVREIGKCAFNTCEKLKEINLQYVEQIGERAFEGCESLEKVTFGKNLKKLSKGAFRDCLGLTEIEFQGGSPQIAKTAFKNDRFLKKITNHSEVSIPLGKLDKDLFWYQDGKKVTSVSSGKTARCKGRLFRVTYKDLKGKFEGKLPKTYRYAEDKYLPTKAKRKGYFFYGWSMSGLWLSDLCDIRGNLTLTPIWIKYDVTKLNSSKRKLTYEISKKYDYFSSRTAEIRCSTNMDMKKSKIARCYNLWKGSFTLKKLKKGKKYYVQFRTRDEDSKSPWSNPIVIKN